MGAPRALSASVEMAIFQKSFFPGFFLVFHLIGSQGSQKTYGVFITMSHGNVGSVGHIGKRGDGHFSKIIFSIFFLISCLFESPGPQKTYGVFIKV